MLFQKSSIPYMLFEPCYQMAGCLPEIARLAAWTCDFIDNMALEHAGTGCFPSRPSPVLVIISIINFAVLGLDYDG